MEITIKLDPVARPIPLVLESTNRGLRSSQCQPALSTREYGLQHWGRPM